MTARQCRMKTVDGNVCHSRPKHDLDVCSNHICHWVAQDPRAIFTLARLRVFRFGAVHPYGFGTHGKGQIAGLPKDAPGREVIVYVAKRPGEAMPPKDRYHWSDRKGMTGVRLTVKTAIVVADFLESLGDGPAAERIRAVASEAPRSTPC